MNLKHLFTGLCVSAATVAASSLPAHAAFVGPFYDLTFQQANYIVGNNPPLASSTAGVTNNYIWHAVYTGTNQILVENGYTDPTSGNTLGGGGDKVIVFHKDNTGGNPIAYFYMQNADKPSTGIVSIKADVLDTYTTSNTQSTRVWRITDSNSKSADLTFQAFNGKLYLRLNYTGAGYTDYIWGDGTQAGSGLGKVFSIDWQFNIDTGLSKLWLDKHDGNGLLPVAQTTTSFTPGTYSYASLIPAANSNPRDPIAFDNINIGMVVPEPASLALMGLGGLMLLLRGHGGK